MAYPNSFRCVVATPTRELFAGEVYYADVPGFAGYYGVVKGHESLVATNHQGGLLTLWLDPDGNEKKQFLLHRGCTQMLHDHLAVLGRFGRAVEELDLERSKRRAEEIRQGIEERKQEMTAEDSEDRRAADEAWIDAEEVHMSWHEAVVVYLEEGRESYKM